MVFGKKNAIAFFLSLAQIFQLLKKQFMAKAKRTNPSKRSKKKTTTEIVKRHLSDKNDKITEDDFHSLHIDTSLPADEAHEPLPIEDKKDRPKDVEKDNSTTTPWDVISE